MVMLLGSKAWGQGARTNNWDSGLNPIGCDVKVLVPYDNSNTITGTPATAIGTLPFGLTSNGGFTLVFEDQFNSINPLLKSEQIPGQPFNYLNRIWKVTDGGNPNGPKTENGINSTDVNFGVVSRNPGKPCLFLKQEVTNPNGIVSKSDFKTTAIKSMSSFRYGYIEARIRVPDRKKNSNTATSGLFPAFWMRGGDGSSEVSEIDIFEMFQRTGAGSTEKIEYATTTHFCTKVLNANGQFVTDDVWQKQIQPVKAASVTGCYQINLNKDFFLWGVRWTPTQLSFYFNNTFVFSEPNPFYPISPGKTQVPMEIWFNCNVFQDHIENNTDFPDSMFVDYVRVYKDQDDFYTMLTEFPDGQSFCVGNPIHVAIEEHLNNCTYSWSLLNPFTNTVVYGPIATIPLTDHHFISGVIPNLATGPYKLRLSLGIPAIGTQAATTKYTERIIHISAAPPSVLPSIAFNSTNNMIASFSPSMVNSTYTYMWGNTPTTCNVAGNSTSRGCGNTGPVNGTVYMKAQNACGISSSYSSTTYSLSCNYTPPIPPNCPGCQVRNMQPSEKDDSEITVLQPPIIGTNTLTSITDNESTGKGENTDTIPSFSSSAFQLYPNPANKVLHFVSQEEAGEIQIWSIEGKKVLQQRFEKGETLLNTEQLAEGIYQLRITTPTTTSNLRFTLQH